jgi:hypothetical protein
MVRIKSVRVLEGYRVKLGFTDGTAKSLDLTPFLEGPVFEELKADRTLFEAVKVETELGTIVWPNGADICPDVLRWDRVPAAREREDL